MANRHFLFLNHLKDNLDDVLDRPQIPPLIEELKKRLPEVNAQTLEIIIAASFAILDTVDAENKPR